VTGFDRGDVGVVAPLNATQSLWGVLFAALLYGRSEAVGRRTVLAGVLVVLGGSLIGAFR
jgi:drug/metabolite transporter (DMT)-like permease